MEGFNLGNGLFLQEKNERRLPLAIKEVQKEPNFTLLKVALIAYLHIY